MNLNHGNDWWCMITVSSIYTCTDIVHIVPHTYSELRKRERDRERKSSQKYNKVIMMMMMKNGIQSTKNNNNNKNLNKIYFHWQEKFKNKKCMWVYVSLTSRFRNKFFFRFVSTKNSKNDLLSDIVNDSWNSNLFFFK